MTYNNKFVPQAPKTYEVRYVELKEPSKISKFAGYLGVKTVENCCHLRPVPIRNNNSSSSSTSVSSTKSTQAEVVASAIKTTAEVGGKSTIKTNSDGTTNITYDSGKSAR
jgi:hypothetical protein